MENINWMAVAAAALANFLLGGLWYSPALFGKRWQKENNLSDEALKNTNMLRVFGFALLWSVVMAVDLGFFLSDPKTDIVWGITAGFLAGFGWVAPAVFMIGLFERKSTVYMLINGGYMIVSFVVMGMIIGAWR